MAPTKREQELGPEYKTIFNPATCTRRGLCPVTQIRNKGDPFESHSIYFEQHGTGPEKILYIMGLNSTSFSWLNQIEHFGSSPRHSSLVFDNRGIGHSGSPRGPYTTSGMAEDAIALLDYIGWTEKRGIHVVGVSLGGMIAQELAYRIPERIASLTLVVTTPGGKPWTNFPSWKGISMIANLFFIVDIERKIPIVVDTFFPLEWLDQKAEGDPAGRTNREVQKASYRRRIELTKPQTAMGSLSQMIAALTHSVSPERLRSISKSIPKVLLLVGDDDHLVDTQNSFNMKKHMPEAELIQWELSGHALVAQHPAKFNKLLERIVEEGRAKAAQFDDEH